MCYTDTIVSDCDACRYQAATAMVGNVLAIHGGEAAPGALLPDMAALDLSPLLAVWPAGAQMTCSTLAVAMGALPAFNWMPGWRVCSTAVGPVKQHALAVYQTSATAGLVSGDVLLLHGGLVAGTFEQVCCFGCRTLSAMSMEASAMLTSRWVLKPCCSDWTAPGSIHVARPFAGAAHGSSTGRASALSA